MTTRKTKVRRTMELLDKYLAAMGSPSPRPIAVYPDQLEALRKGKKLDGNGRYRGIPLRVVSNPCHLPVENGGAVASARTRISLGPARLSMPTAPKTSRLASVT